MRSRQSFLLTIMTPECDPTSLRGRLKVIASGKTHIFTSIDELYHLLSAEMEEQPAQSQNGLSLTPSTSQGPASAD